MKAIRLGFVGLGHISTKSHLPPLSAMAEAGEVVLQAFCDVNADTVGEQVRAFGARKGYTDHREMLEKEDLDGVYLCIPPTLHTDAEEIAADRGIALFIEKPQTLDIGQAVKYNNTIRSAGIVSQVGFMSRYYTSAEKAREILADRTPRHAQIQLFYSGRSVRYWTSRFELCGGSFVENTIHMVDLVRYLLGDIEATSAFYHHRKPGEGPEPINMPHVYNVNFQFRSGVVANATTSRALTNVQASRREVIIISDDSLLEWSAQKVVENGKTVWEVKDRENAFAAQARAFVDAVRKGEPGLMRSPYDDALNSLAAVLGANASAERGGALVKLDEFVSTG